MTDETMKLKEVVVSHDADDTLTVCTACAYALATLKRMPSDWKAEGEADLERVIAALLHKLAPNHEFAAMWIADATRHLNGEGKPLHIELVKGGRAH